MVLFYLFKNGKDNIQIGRSFGQAFVALTVFGGLYSLIIPYINHTPKERYADVVDKRNLQAPKSDERDYAKPIKKVKF